MIDQNQMDGVYESLTVLRRNINGTDCRDGDEVRERLTELANVVGELASVVQDHIINVAPCEKL